MICPASAGTGSWSGRSRTTEPDADKFLCADHLVERSVRRETERRREATGRKWTFVGSGFWTSARPVVRRAARLIERLGYGALWVGEAGT
jgi:hypothetical protein